MFERFGEFDNYTEINTLAENLFNEGDELSIHALAKENGIPDEFATEYVKGNLPELADSFTAGVGKLNIEEQEIKPEGIMVDWVEYIRCQACDDDRIALALRKKDKSLKACIAELLKWAFGHQKEIDKDILKAAGVTASRVTLGMPGLAEAKKIIKEYYLGK